MKNFLYRLAERLQRFMYGRYGNDELGIFMSILIVVFVFLSFFEPLRFFYIPALLLMIASIFRCYSKNIAKRRRELNIYLKIAEKPKQFIRQRKRMWADRKTHCYAKCRGCKTYLRVPRGKGKIVITCPKCHSQIEKKT